MDYGYINNTKRSQIIFYIYRVFIDCFILIMERSPLGNCNDNTK